MKKIWPFLRGKVLPLFLGETFWRLSMLAALALISRRFSVGEFGAFNLGLVLYQYAVMFTDFGTRAIGARLIAIGRYPDSWVVAGVGRKRIRLFMAALAAVCFYVLLTPSAPWALLLFAMAALFTGMSHEWVFWAQERYWHFAGWRSLVGLLVFLLVAAAVSAGGGIAALALGLVGAMAGGMVLSWAMSTVPARWPPRGTVDEIEALRWREISLLGLALVANQLFQTGDVMLLGVLSDQHQLGIYGAASRLVMFLFGVYYLAAQALYPWLVRRFAEGPLDRKTVFLLLGGASLCGLGMAGMIYPFQEDLIRLAFGKEMAAAGAAGVFGVLVFVLPLELVMGTWGMMATAAGRNRWALQITAIGALSNLLLNVLLIPTRGALGAAYASLLSYGLVLIAILITASKFTEAKTIAKSSGETSHG